MRVFPVRDPKKFVDVHLKNTSFEENGGYPTSSRESFFDSLKCRIVLCSLQYTEEVHKTLAYVIGKGYQMHIQWLNPGNNQPIYLDKLGLVPQLLSSGASVSIGESNNLDGRVQEIRECIYGWAYPRDLIYT